MKIELPNGVVVGAKTPVITFVYTNYRNEISPRRVQPLAIEFKETEYHTKQWIMTALDFEKDAIREFAMGDMKDVEEEK